MYAYGHNQKDDDPEDNIAGVTIGGISVPWHKPDRGIITLLVPIAWAILLIAALGMIVIDLSKWRTHLLSKTKRLAVAEAKMQSHSENSLHSNRTGN